MESAQVVTHEDSVGEKMRVLHIGDDCITPIAGLQEALPKLMELPVKDNDILITAYPRSGTHFLWEVIRMLKNNSAEYIQGEKEAENLELFFRNGLENKTDRVLNTHFAPACLPKDMKQGKCKIVHVYRNPKDVMVSHFNHTMNFKAFYQYGGSFSGFFEMAMAGHVETGRWFDYELKYEKFFKANPQIPAKFVAYEDMLKNPIDTMRQLSVFLGLSRDEKLFDEIAEAVSFQKMKAAKYNLKSNILKPGMSLDGYNNMYRKGKSGDWKNWFTVAQNEIFDDEFNRCMEGSDLKDKIKF